MPTSRLRQTGEKLDITVYANPDEYASFPQLVRTDRKLALLFPVQNLEKLRVSAKHAHYQPVSEPCWATSSDGGMSWKIHAVSPALNHVLDIGYGSAPRTDGGTVTLSSSASGLFHATIEHGSIGGKNVRNIPITDTGPFSSGSQCFWFGSRSVARLTDGMMIAASYTQLTSQESEQQKTTAVFLVSVDEGITWRYLSHIPNRNIFSFSEPSILPTRDGRLLVLLRVDWDQVPVDQRPAEANDGYGYFLYQTESVDGGHTWTEPFPLSLWGHPPSLLRLASGNILLVYGHRRDPWEIRAILSFDEGRTWDPKTLRSVYRFDPGNYDFGYPLATQLPDSTIVCAYYGYSTPDVRENMPHGVFVSLFDETWLTEKR